MQICLCTVPRDVDLITPKRFRFVMERLGDVAKEVDEKLQGLLSVRDGVAGIIYSLSL